MKINKLLLFAAVILFTASCTKNEQTAVIPEPETNAAEDIVLAADVVTDNFIVASATKVIGAPPTPNGNISVDISTTEQSAFLKAGFNIEFAQNNSVTGAYIQILEADGTPSSAYFDVPSAGFSSDLSGPSGKDKNIFTAKNGDDDENSIDVDFGSEMSPGTFCYVICFYDDQGNISTPEEICVEVESWGGSTALVGDWELQRYVSQDGEEVAGEQICEDDGGQITCASGESLQPEYCVLIELNILLEENGDFYLKQKNEYFELDYTASADSCTLIYETEIEANELGGKWAYDEEEERLTLVLITTGTNDWSDSDYVEGELVFDGETIVSGNSMELHAEYGDYTEVYYFTK